MNLKALLFLSLLLICCSCQEKQTEIKQEEQQKGVYALPTIINWSVFNNSGWNAVSFPIWFDDAIIKRKEIESIQIRFVNYNTDSIVNVADTLPYLSMDFKFLKNGEIDTYTRKDFFYEKKVGEHLFSYLLPKDSMGYSIPNITPPSKEIISAKSFLELYDLVQENEQFERLEKRETTPQLQAYKMKNSFEEIYHYYILDTTHQNLSYIDNKIQAQEEDVLFYGSPLHYSTAFKIRNLVEKTPLEERLYNENNSLLSQVFYQGDFLTKRNFFYNDSGVCFAYTDSLFYGQSEFIQDLSSTINYKDTLPTSINTYTGEKLIHKVFLEYSTRQK